MEALPQTKRAPNPSLDNPRRKELNERLAKMVAGCIRDMHSDGVTVPADPDAVRDQYREKWHILCRQVNAGPEPIHMDPGLFDAHVDGYLKSQARQKAGAAPISDVDLSEFGFARAGEHQFVQYWLTSSCLIGVHTNASVDIYLLDSHRIDGLLQDIRNGLQPSVRMLQATVAKLGGLLKLAGYDVPATPSEKQLMQVTAKLPGYWPRLANAILNR